MGLPATNLADRTARTRRMRQIEIHENAIVPARSRLKRAFEFVSAV
jgi:hypothetical protein